MYKLIDGKQISARIREELKEKISAYKLNTSRDIGLAVILVGNNQASQVYVRNKIRACDEVGIRSYLYELPADAAQADLEKLITFLAGNKDIQGILLQLPLPSGFDADAAMKLIPVEKDVDGFSAENIGRLCLNENSTVACTPFGIMKMLDCENIEIKGKKAVVVGRSNIVGKPMAMLLLNADATVTVCHSKTENLAEECRRADILISAVGKPKFITKDMVREGAVVIDVGMNRDENGKLCGDVDFENVKDKCSYITPVPGGVGPMTVTMLMLNTYIAASRSLN